MALRDFEANVVPNNGGCCYRFTIGTAFVFTSLALSITAAIQAYTFLNPLIHI